MGITIQYIIAAILGVAAVVYLVYHIRHSTEVQHDCPDCGVSQLKNSKKTNTKFQNIHK